MSRTIRVVKIGGSVLDDSALAVSLRAWFAGQAPSLNLIVVGGGRFADAVRYYDQQQVLGENAHWLAIKAMGLAADLLCSICPEFGAPRSWADATSICHARASEVAVDSELVLIDALDFVIAQETPCKMPLPRSWDVTSDSIAALVAQRAKADELVLLKSTLPDRTLPEGGLSSFVDAAFVDYLAGIPRIRAVNLRQADFPEVDLTGLAATDSFRPQK
jgi:aspartokinase-like uncharacterized kinase